ncbi:MAG: Coenzyme A biosynthesis bifunctional protein CoaBC [Firmicutes bacterium]|nr:Coenzyme A biosynthesis bifunctional protein CoaBC [candidate division NPL-UPA2 bacterium]
MQKQHIVLGVTGSIAVYKAADLTSRLVKAGYIVDVVMTEAAQEFVQPLTFQALTHRPLTHRQRQGFALDR